MPYIKRGDNLKKIICFNLLILILVMVSCSTEANGLTNVKLNLVLPKEFNEDGELSRNAKTVLPIGEDENPVSISYYILSGTGPSNTSFGPTKSSIKTQIVYDLIPGTWKIRAEAYSAEDVLLVYGEKDVTLSAEVSNEIGINLSSYFGTGKVLAHVYWNSDIAKEAILKVFLQTDNNSKWIEQEAQTITGIDGNMVWQRDIDAGSYSVRFVLYVQDTPIAGVVEAFRVSNNKTSEGNINISLTDNRVDPNFGMEDNYSEPIKGEIVNTAKRIYASSPTLFTFVPEKTNQAITCIWYVDGNIAVDNDSDSNSLTFSCELAPGTHTITTTAKHSKIGSLGSASTTVAVLDPMCSVWNVNSGETVNFRWPSDLSQHNDVFTGWLLSGQPVNFPYIATSDITLDADYREVEDVFTFTNSAITGVKDNDIKYVAIPASFTAGEALSHVGEYGENDSFSNYTSGFAAVKGVAIIAEEFEIGRGMFNNSTIESLTVAGNIKTVGEYAFARTSKLPIISFPKGLKTIEKGAFEKSIALEGIALPYGLETIADAFFGCKKLTSITIPATVTSIKYESFATCPSLLFFDVTAGGEIYSSKDGALLSFDGKTLYAYPRGRLRASYAIPEGVNRIEDKAFSFCSKLSTILLPLSLKEIGSSAFSDCSELTNIIIPTGVTSIPNSAFRNCYALAKISIPLTVKQIGDYAFDGCARLKTVNYEGNASDWSAITIGPSNSELTADVEFNYGR